MARPLVWAALGLSAGVFLGHAASDWGAAAVAAPLLVAFFLWVGARGASWQGLAVLLAVFASAGAALWLARDRISTDDLLFREVSAHPGDEYVLEGTVRESTLILPGTTYGSFVLDVEEFAAKGAKPPGTPSPSDAGVLVRWTEPGRPVHPGERVRLTGRPVGYFGPVNHETSSMEDMWRSRGVTCLVRLHGGAVESLVLPSWSAAYWASRLRHWQGCLFQRVLPPEALPYALAVWLGDRSLLAPGLNEQFVNSGTAHILSVSGVHMSMVYLSAAFVLGLFIPSRWLRAVLISGIIVVYTLMSGACVASLRSALMILLYLSAEVLDREPDAPTALGLSAIILLLWDPHWLFDGGFLLSYLSLASILLFSARLNASLGWLPWLVRADVATSLTVQVLPLPLAARFFHVLPLAGPVANLLVIPLTTVTLWLCAAVVVMGLVFPPGAVLFGAALHAVVWCILRIVEWTANLPGSRLLLLSPTGPAMAVYWVGALALYFGLRPDPRWAAGAFAALSTPATGWQRWRDRLTSRSWALGGAAVLLSLSFALWSVWARPCGVDVLDVGHADAIFVRTPSGKGLLVDGGDRTAYMDAGRQTVLPFLYANGVKTLDTIVNTHPDSDHLGGLLSVIERMPVRRVVLGPVEGRTSLESALAALCEKRGVEVLRMARGESLDCGGALVEVLHPTRTEPAGSDNNGSLVLRLSWTGFSILLAGDIERAAEKEVAGSDCRAMVLKVAHHGSATSTTGEFLDAVSPSLAVISTGLYRNTSSVGIGVIERLRSRSIPVWRTDQHGGVRIVPKEGALEVSGARDIRGYTLAP